MTIVSQRRDGDTEIRQKETRKCYLNKIIHMGKSELES